jgi:hypothetical protein
LQRPAPGFIEWGVYPIFLRLRSGAKAVN